MSLAMMAGKYEFFGVKLKSALMQDLVATFLLLVVVMVVRAALLRLVKRTEWATEGVRLRWRAQVRLLVFVIFGFGLLLVWGAELRTLALSLVAFAVALVIATKELILCLMGSVVRLGSQSFSVGDRIEVTGVRGDVISTGLLATQVLEIGPAHQRTGRAVVVPNSVLLSQAVTNETFGDEFILHVIPVKLPSDADWQSMETALLQAARSVTERYRETARISLDGMAERHHLKTQAGESSSTGEPRVLVRVLDEGRIELLVRVPTRARDKGQVEQDVLRGFLEHTAKRRAEA